MPLLRKIRSPHLLVVVAFYFLICSCASGRTVALEGSSFAKTNTRFVIDKMHNLGGKTIQFGANDTLVFKGGVLVNGVVVGNNTYVDASEKLVFQKVTLAGSWDKNTIACPEWFGAKGDGMTDDAAFIQQALDHFRKVRLGKKKYAVSKTIQVHSYTEFYGSGDRSILYNLVNSGYDKSIVNV